MVGVNFFLHRIGTVAIFATLFVASYVNGEKGCVFDFEHDDSDFEFECSDAKNSWTVNENLKEPSSINKKAVVLEPEKGGCLKTKHPMQLNSSSKVVLRFMSDAAKEDTGKLIVRLVPKEGSCPDEECVWNLGGDSQYVKGQWVSAEHKFPLKSKNDFYIQLQVNQHKGKFVVDHIAIPDVASESGRCHPGNLGTTLRAPSEEPKYGNSLSDQLTGAAKNESSLAPGLADISKSLMLTSASVLTLNNLLN